jgi:Uma2 family endonuclease
MTVEEFRKLPEDAPVQYELHHGELVQLTRPKARHFKVQKRVETLLEAAARDRGVVAMEFAFRAVPEGDLRVADVGYVTRDRWNAIDPDDNLQGAPDLAVEILSPSNTAAELYDGEKLCLEHGCREFWIVDPDLRQVKVSTPDGITATYPSGHEVPLRLFGSGTLQVDEIFRT